MAEMTIRLRVCPDTGKKDIIVSLRSDEDALPHEHEQQHRNLLDQLIEGGMVKAGEVGKLIIEREEEHTQAEPLSSPNQETERQSHEQGN